MKAIEPTQNSEEDDDGPRSIMDALEALHFNLTEIGRLEDNSEQQAVHMAACLALIGIMGYMVMGADAELWFKDLCSSEEAAGKDNGNGG